MEYAEKPRSFAELLYQSPIGRRIKAARILQGWSVDALSKTAHVSRTTIENAERGRSISSASLIAIARALCLSLDDLTIEG